jgi:hypothetical protein
MTVEAAQANQLSCTAASADAFPVSPCQEGFQIGAHGFKQRPAPRFLQPQCKLSQIAAVGFQGASGQTILQPELIAKFVQKGVSFF